MHSCIRECVCARPAAACVTLVNIKAARCFAELTNLSHPSPRAAFETHTAGLGSGLWTLSHSLPRPPCSSPVSNCSPVKYLLISTLALFFPFDLILIWHSWINSHHSGWRCDHNGWGHLRLKRTFYTFGSRRLKSNILHFNYKTPLLFITHYSSMICHVFSFNAFYCQIPVNPLPVSQFLTHLMHHP